MPLAFLLDEHLRGVVWRALQRHNAGGLELLDAIRVGDAADLPLGTLDPALLLWAEREGRILISRNASTLYGHLADHLQSGNHCPGDLHGPTTVPACPGRRLPRRGGLPQ